MSDHRTLDEFGGEKVESASDEDDIESAGNDATEDADGSTDAKADDTDPVEEDTETVDPPATTYRWAPDGAACERCDAVVERRWRDDGAFVCADCKEW